MQFCVTHFLTGYINSYLSFFIKILFAVFNVLFVGYSLAKNNLNNTYQYNMIPKHFSKTIRITTVTLGYCLLTDKQKITNKIRKSVYGGILVMMEVNYKLIKTKKSYILSRGPGLLSWSSCPS
jgi:hypothetical protein